MREETQFSLSTSASTGSSVCSGDSDDGADPVFFNPVIVSVKNTFLEFCTDEVAMPSFSHRRAKSAPDVFPFTEPDCQQGGQQHDSTSSKLGFSEFECTRDRADMSPSCEEVIRDTFLKFGWPLSSNHSRRDAAQQSTETLPQMQPPVRALSTVAQIPPPPAAPPSLPLAMDPMCKYDGAALVGSPFADSPYTTMTCSMLDFGPLAQVPEENEDEIEQQTQQGSPMLRQSDIELDRKLGSPDCPTLGSVGHWKMNCKPCAFFHKKGCNNGVACEFCHLCDAGEKQRRQKEKHSRLQIHPRRTRLEYANRWSK